MSKDQTKPAASRPFAARKNAINLMAPPRLACGFLWQAGFQEGCTAMSRYEHLQKASWLKLRSPKVLTGVA